MDFLVVEVFQEDGKMFEEIIEKMKDIVGDNLISAVKFGSEGKPNNLLLVLNKLDFDVMNKIKPLIINHRKKGNIVPLIFTKEELFEGVDVFPLEFLDIKQPHKTIYGEEIVDKIELNKKHVRRQLEFEFRSKLIHLRENYIWINRNKELKNLLISAVPTLMPLFYGLLFLKNIKAPTNLDELFGLVNQNYNVNFDVLKKINQIKKGEIKIKDEKLDLYVKELIVLLTNLGKIVDEIKV